MCRRIAGPGLASTYFVQITPDEAIVALRSELERRELDVFSTIVKEQINLPSVKYRNFIERVIRPFGSFSSGNRYEPVDSQVEKQNYAFDEAVNVRKSILPHLASTDIRQVSDS